MSDRLKEMADKAIENLKKQGAFADAPPVARAYAKGIPTIIATDAEAYFKMTLEEIAEEWDLEDPVDLLAAISKADERGELKYRGKG